MNSKDVLDFNLSNKDKMIQKAKKKFPNFNLENPKTIQEKLCWLNIYDVDGWDKMHNKPLKSVCADKILIKEYSKQKIGENIGIPTLKIYNKVSDIKWDELPNKFVIKCNHGSGMNIICTDKSKLNIKDAESKLNKWMNDDYTFRHGFESHYHWIDRKIFVEEYKNDGNKDLIDYKFLCFNGEPKICQVVGGRNESSKHLNYYDLNFNFLTYSRKDFPSKLEIKDKKPTNFEKMVKYAKKLSEDFKFVRVDFYEINNQIYLGELTFTPGVCLFEYEKQEDNLKMGNMLNL